MSKVICKLENASTLINGIQFSAEDGIDGLVSEEVSDAVSALFLSIPGYILYGEDENSDAETEASSTKRPQRETAAQRKNRLKAELEAEKKAAESGENS